MNIWQFMSDSPFLTFFVLVVLVNGVVAVVRAVANRNKPVACCEHDDDDE